MNLGEGWLSESQPWDRHQTEGFWILLRHWVCSCLDPLPCCFRAWSIFKSSALGTMVTCPVQLSLLSPMTSTSTLHFLVSNLPTHSTVSHLKTSNTFLNPYCHSISLVPLAAQQHNHLELWTLTYLQSLLCAQIATSSHPDCILPRLWVISFG